MEVREVFLSHSSCDSEFVDLLVKTLRAHGIPVWVSNINVRGAQQWHDEIGAALRRCDWFAVVLTPGSVSSMWVKREVMFALGEPRFEGRIIPIFAQECDTEILSWAFSGIQRVDFSVSREEGIRELLRVWDCGFDPHKNFLM